MLLRARDPLTGEPGEMMSVTRPAGSDGLQLVPKVGTLTQVTPGDPCRTALYDTLSNAGLDLCGLPVEGRDGLPVATLASPDDAARPTDAPRRCYFEDPRTRACAWNIELTGSCTLACRHCYQSTRKCEPWDAPPGPHAASWKQLAEALIAQQPSDVSLSGGEVILFDATAALLGYLRSASPDTPLRILLSGMALSHRRSFHELLPRLAEWDVLAKVAVYSAYDPIHDWVTRSPGSLRDTLDLVQALQDAGVRLRVSHEVLSPTAPHAIETIDFVRERVGPDVTVTTLVYPPRSPRRGDTGPSLQVEAHQLRTLLDQEEFAALPVEYLSFQPRCTSGCRFPTVLPDGEVWGCAVHAGSACGNLYEDAQALSRARRFAPDPDGPADPTCDGCVAKSVCKRCVACVEPEEWRRHYCDLVRVCTHVVAERIRGALSEGYAFVHPEARARWDDLQSRLPQDPEHSRREGAQRCRSS